MESFDQKIDNAFDAIYRRYGTNLSAFFEDAYKAQRERANQPDVSAERSRLEREVIEAAKKWHADRFGPFDLENRLNTAIANLIDFESSRLQIQK